MDELILEILEDLKKEDFEKFTFYLNKEVLEGSRPIPQGRLEDQSRPGVVTLMKDYYGDKRVNITQEILKKISRNDLFERLENGQSRSKAASPLSSSHQGPDTGNEKLAQRIEEELKPSLERKFNRTFEGFEDSGKRSPLNNIYTEVSIIEGDSKGVNDEHEVRQIETASRKQRKQDTPIKCNDIFKPLPGQEDIRTVLTKGIAGIGKTITVQKFVLDWATGEANQDVDLMFVLPFRELNLIEDEYSLLGLLQEFHPETEGIEKIKLNDCQLVFIFDGLDESRFPLDFQRNKRLSDVKKTSSVDVLLTNLIKGNLLPFALLL
ncbi:hypothetical protein AAFF_G00432220 [Aldrovandia affinis]|uniref:Uncharacterized protein n=1 Tax=Aldrovandia affinis TaxID=143900 RepID=A0AAD7VYE3_9TELE|nr:hypothetical protein AAFF_G00432220 [Aldrovandia affinis]